MKKINENAIAAPVNKESFVWDSISTAIKRVAYERHDIVDIHDTVFDIVRKGNMLVIVDASTGYALEASGDGNPRRQMSGWGYTIRLTYEGITAALKAAKAADDKAFMYLIREYILIKYRRFIKAE